VLTGGRFIYASALRVAVLKFILSMTVRGSPLSTHVGRLIHSRPANWIRRQTSAWARADQENAVPRELCVDCLLGIRFALARDSIRMFGPNPCTADALPVASQPVHTRILWTAAVT